MNRRFQYYVRENDVLRFRLNTRLMLRNYAKMIAEFKDLGF